MMVLFALFCWIFPVSSLSLPHQVIWGWTPPSFEYRTVAANGKYPMRQVLFAKTSMATRSAGFTFQTSFLHCCICLGKCKFSLPTTTRILKVELWVYCACRCAARLSGSFDSLPPSLSLSTSGSTDSGPSSLGLVSTTSVQARHRKTFSSMISKVCGLDDSRMTKLPFSAKRLSLNTCMTVHVTYLG